jgi:hypothetical protein
MTSRQRYSIGCASLAGAVALAIFCIIWFWARDYVTVEITFGEDLTTRIHLPDGVEPDTKATPSRPYDWCDQLEFRATPDPQRLLVRAFQSVDSWATPTGATRLYSLRAFAVEPDHPRRSAAISEQEWSTAPVIETRNRRTVDNHAGDGGRFPVSGDQQAGIVFSPNRKRAAVMSYNSHGGGSWGGNLPSKFTYFIDLFDAASGKLIGEVRGYSHGVDISCVFDSGPTWINDLYFAIPVSRHRDEILLFDFNRKNLHQ